MSSTTTTTQLKNFLPLSKLGQGAFSTVYKVKRVNDGQIYALKKIKMQKLKEKQQINALNEIRILASIKSKYIISYKEAFYDQSLNLLCIVMEYANCGDLQKKITDHQKGNTKFSQKQIWKASAQILIGLYILHQKGILHRDLKSANVFVSNEEYKLGDLNVSKINYEKDQMARTQTGTPYYASPEVWRDQPYDNKCDIWSFGCLIYQMCCFQPPFQGADLDELYKAVQRGKYREIPNIYSAQLKSLIKLCLQLNPKSRPSGKQLFVKFKSLNIKFMECLKNKEFQLDNKLMSTIHLPSDLKDLPKQLPLPEYEIAVKDQPRTLYHQDPENKETVILKNRSGIQENKKVQPLPERIKNYFNDDNKIPIRKRPQRPVTSSKRKQKKEDKQQIRPSSAHYINRRNNETNKKNQSSQGKVHKLKDKILTENQILPASLQKRDLNTGKAPLNELPIIKNIYNPNQYRCKSSEYQRRPRQILGLNSPNQRLNEQHKINRFSSKKGVKDSSLQQGTQISPGMPQNFQINKKLYENCKENGMKKISSLQKKVRYIRDQRKERKVMLEKNKQNISCILKPIINDQSLDMKQRLKDKIKQNSQIFRSKPYEKAPSYMPIIKERINSALSNNTTNPIDRVDTINNHLQKRKNILIPRRYIASADSKRVRSYTEISNDQTTINNERDQSRKYAMVKKVPSHIPSILADKISSKNLSSQPYMKRDPFGYANLQNVRRKETEQKHQSIIDDSQTILRLKKRIKNRIIGHENQQRTQKSILKHNNMRVNPIYY